MAVQLNRASVFTVKYIGENGLKFLDLPAAGMTEAKDTFAREHPGKEVVNIWRKQ